MTTVRHARFLSLAALAASATFALSACAGSAGGGGGGGEGGGSGFDYGASQEDVDAALSELEPVNIVYQAGAQGPNSVSAQSAHAFKEYVEERSGGKITVEVIWAQAIAGYSEIDDALSDGRIDVSYALPIYDPSTYPAFDALATTSAGLPNSPVVGELVGNAAIIDMAWNSEEILQGYEEQGIVPLTPVVSTGNHHAICSDSGTTLDDWKGRQVRIPSVSLEKVASNLGATPVSMEYVEVFEAIQRGTVDCTLAQLLPSEEAGLLEIAPNVSYASPESSLSSRGAGAMLAGSNFQNLPLAYQQIIFDAGEGGFIASSEVIAKGNAAGVKQLREAGGEMAPLDPEAEKKYKETNDELTAQVEEDGLIGSDASERMKEAANKWSGVAEEIGYEEGGDFDSLDEWYDPADFDYAPFAAQLFEEVYLPHRPS
ncbi:TRAP-type C4-dicarboxylate transport system substrate-binding protein [Brevibacterium pityocampae]